ncbi:class I SAM-dependent methyltransferase [Cupriavidus basilensis]|uniref:Putative methyltransferase n=1 Tax=Cupriavidus basilensis TaxID=68895 RepID=A0A0C4YB69_9BURK|nr:class I SAM-dependent methyltransferase [Cupriavidus basilensis]AJG22802.1 putative methyltransferase [Cupriavidus basilensis]
MTPFSARRRFVRHAMLLAGAGMLASAASAAPATADEALAAAIAGPQRSAANKARDVYRHPLQTLRFFGLQPDQAVIEIAPGGGWYTEILAPVLRDHGKLYAAHYDASAADASQESKRSRANFEKKLAQDPGNYGKVTVGTLPVRAFTDIAPPGGADLVLTFRNIHNWIKDGHLDDSLRAFYAVLKPGGVLGVEEHRATPGTSLEQMIATGYVTEDYVIDHARAAGFALAGRSEINANPRDNHDHPDGVWSLPPTLRGGERERASFMAIGESDRMTLKFIKPR